LRLSPYWARFNLEARPLAPAAGAAAPAKGAETKGEKGKGKK